MGMVNEANAVPFIPENFAIDTTILLLTTHYLLRTTLIRSFAIKISMQLTNKDLYQTQSFINGE